MMPTTDVDSIYVANMVFPKLWVVAWLLVDCETDKEKLLSPMESEKCQFTHE